MSMVNLQGEPKGSERFFKNGCGIQMSQATPTKFSMLFKHNYGKLFWKFGDHSFNFSFVHGPSWLRVLESIHRYGVIFTFWFFFSKGHCEAMLDVKKNTLLTFKGICMNFLLELRFFILSHPVTSKQPHKIVQIHMVHPIEPQLTIDLNSWYEIACIRRYYSLLFAPPIFKTFRRCCTF